MRLSEYTASELGRWRTAQRGADDRLRPFVQGYFGSDGFLPRALREHHLPAFGVPLVLNFASPHRLIERDPCDIAWGQRAWIVGLQSRHRFTDALGSRDFLIAQLTPIGAHHLLRAPMHALADRIVDVEDIDPSFARSLLARVDAASGWEERFEALERTLLERFAAKSTIPSIAPAALARLEARSGDLGIGSLASAFGCSPRSLIDAFRDQVGMTPKAVARLLRFNKAVAAINRNRNVEHLEGKPYLDGGAGLRCGKVVRWSELALACGYYDQPHFTREFQAFSGSSPGAFLTRLSAAA